MENNNQSVMTTTSTAESDVKKVNILKRIWSYRRNLKFEVFVIFCLLPGYLTQVSVNNLSMEKACRLNFNYSGVVCAAILEKDESGLSCDGFRTVNDTEDGSGASWNVIRFSLDLNFTVCKAEQQVQKMTANIFGIRSIIAAILPLIVVLLAGTWSDRYNKRKPCILVPLVGSILGFLVQLISSVFFYSIPLEVGMYLEALLPALFGGSTLFFMAIYSYLSAITPEPDRVFRFGIFFVAANCASFIGTLLDRYVYTELGYTGSFVMGLAIISLALAYGVVFLEEVQMPVEPDTMKAGGIDNKGFDSDGDPGAVAETKAAPENQQSTTVESKSTQSCLAGFFDPTLAIGCIKVLLRKRLDNEQSLLAVLLVAYILGLCPSSAEAEYWRDYTLRKLDWNTRQHSLYESYSAATGIIGTFFGATVLSKIFKFSDPMIGIAATLSVIISRPIFAFAKTSIMVYIAVTIEMFMELSAIAIRAIGSTIVQSNELGRMYALLSISETLAGIAFPYIYNYIYSRTVETFPGAIYLLTELFVVPNIYVFLGCFVLLKLRHVPQVEAVKTSDEPVEVTRF